MNSPESSLPSFGTQEMDQIEPPSPWRPLVVPAIIVIVGLAICWALFAHFGRSKPDASGVILRQVVYPVQVDSAVSQPEPGMAGTPDQQSETIILVQARVTNISKKPLNIFDMVADVNVNGAGNQSFAALPEDIDRMFQRFPDLAGMRMQPLARHQEIAPGQSAEGLVVFSYPWSQQQWSQRKNAHMIVSFQNGRSLVLPLQ